jgi:hypothetical protein
VLAGIRQGKSRHTVDTRLAIDHLPTTRGHRNKSAGMKEKELTIELANESLLARLSNIHNRKNEFCK